MTILGQYVERERGGERGYEFGSLISCEYGPSLDQAQLATSGRSLRGMVQSQGEGQVLGMCPT